MGLLDLIKRLFGCGDDRRGVGSEYGPGLRDEIRPPRSKEGPARSERKSAPAPRMRHGRSLHPRLPELPDKEALARALGITTAELLWLADPYRLAAMRTPHYRARILKKKNGGQRLVLAPRPKLKAAQRWILRSILDQLPPPPCAHGFVRGRSIRSNAEPHVGRDMVIGMDLHDFFHQFTFKQVSGFFHHLGYSRETARTLSFLTTAPVRQLLKAACREARCKPADLWPQRPWMQVSQYHPCLPQGSPTSPSLANHLSVRLDRRLSALAARFEATYTRYADDLTFSGGAGLRKGMRRFIPLSKRIIRAEGFRLARGKLRVARKSARQTVTGLVVNEKVNVAAPEYRTLRAILHNCVRHGPASQNRDNHEDFRAHLEGRIAFYRWINPARAEALRRQLDQIPWSVP
ncbi:MAG: reverse transcriptase family protein [Planctomycetota bacterium]